MDRAEAIKFKLMPDGHIRGHDTRKGTGISEGHITPPYAVCDTITVAHAPKLLIVDERLLATLHNAILR